MHILKKLLLSFTLIDTTEAFIVYKSNSFQDTTKCEMCVHGIDMLEQELLSTVNPKQIKDTVAEICSIFQKPSQNTTCIKFLGEIIDNGMSFIKNYAPYKICEELSVCAPKTAKQKKEKTHLTEFVKFKKQFKKMYKDIEEYLKRHRIFRENYEFIQSENKKGHSFTLGINHLADLTNDEFKNGYLNKVMNYHTKNELKGNYECKQQNYFDNGMLNVKQYPRYLDWNEKGVLGKIRDQSYPRPCGSCYDMATIENIQAIHAIHTGELVELSPQEILDFDKNDLSCDGGLPSNVLGYVIKNGICHEEDCPYHAEKDGSCNRNLCQDKVHIDDCLEVEPLNQDALIKAIQDGPVIAAIEADTKYFQLYQSGILDNAELCKRDLDHAILIYAVNLDEKTWTIRNSWSSTWGENGSARIAMTDDNPYGICGLYSQMNQAIIYNNLDI